MDVPVCNQSSGDNDEAFLTKLALTLAFLVLLIYMILQAYIEKWNNKFVHETGIGIVIGIFIGMIFYFVEPEYYTKALKFNQQVFMLVLLPPIIFSAGYNLNRTTFFKNIRYTLAFGVLGTIINFGVFCGLSYLYDKTGLIRRYSNFDEVVHIPTRDLLLFSATNSATDSVAPLAMISQAQYPTLFAVVFGEGMANDAVSIILFYAALNLAQTEFKWWTPFQLIGYFLENALLSIVIGLLYGIIATLILKKMYSIRPGPFIQTLLIFISGMMSYMTAMIFNFSGIISILITGIFMSYYLVHNLPVEVHYATIVMFESISKLFEAFIYVYLGLSVWQYKGSKIYWSWTFFLLTILTTFIGRFFTVYPIHWLFRKISGPQSWKITPKEIFVLYYAGCIRGAVAFALILSLNGDNPSGQILQSTTLFLVILTTVVFGSFMSLVTKKTMGHQDLPVSPDNTLGNAIIQTKKQRQNYFLQAIDSELIEDPEKLTDSFIKRNKSHCYKLLKDFDERIVRVWFINAYETRSKEVKEQRKILRTSVIDGNVTLGRILQRKTYQDGAMPKGHQFKLTGHDAMLTSDNLQLINQSFWITPPSQQEASNSHELSVPKINERESEYDQQYEQQQQSQKQKQSVQHQELQQQSQSQSHLEIKRPSSQSSHDPDHDQKKQD